MASKEGNDVDKKSKRISFGEVNTIIYEKLEPEPEPKDEKKESTEEEPKTKEDESRREWMMNFLKMSLGFGPPPEKVLETLDLDGVAKYIQSGKCKNIITMAGAGISTSAGIPDFRSPGTGLYDNLQKYNLPHPQAVFDICYFWKNPEPFFSLAKELWPGVFKPTPCHYFIRMLQDKGLLLRHYTQNIDTLESHAGVEPGKLVEAHGSFRTAHCLICEKEYSKDFIEEKVLAGEVPKCAEPDCEDSIVKPDIVFFGEALPDRFRECTAKDFDECDLLIVMGTSLVVQPFGSLTSRVGENVPRLYINLEKTGSGPSNPISVLMFGGGFKFDCEDNHRDVFWQGTCDDGCFSLAEKLGWKDELTKLVEEQHAKIDEELKVLKSKCKGSKLPGEKEKKETEKSKSDIKASPGEGAGLAETKMSSTAKVSIPSEPKQSPPKSTDTARVTKKSSQGAVPKTNGAKSSSRNSKI